LEKKEMKKILLNLGVIVGCTIASNASAVNHDQTFPAMLEMVTSATPEELERIKENFCLGQFAAVMTASDIRGRAAELATDDFTEQQIFDLAGVVAVQFSTVYANVCK